MTKPVHDFYWIDDETGVVWEINKEGALITGLWFNSERTIGRRRWRIALAWRMIRLWLRFAL